MEDKKIAQEIWRDTYLYHLRIEQREDPVEAANRAIKAFRDAFRPKPLPTAPGA